MADQVGRMVKTRGDQRHLGGNIIGGDPDTYSYVVADWLVSELPISTVLDVGSGEGHMVRCFQDLHCDAIGLEGLPRNAEASTSPTIVWDITDGPLRVSNIDLVWCVEVAEHIDEEFVDDFIDTLSNGKYVMMTYATPGQAGYHHVNCQPEEYWLEKMEDKGYVYLEDGTIRMRNFASGFVAKTGLLFGKPEC